MHINSNLPKSSSWYDNNKRSLPWRVGKTHLKSFIIDSYEFMLQQTQVATVIPYFKKFTKNFKLKVFKVMSKKF